jgi:hypothetical protein
MQRRGGYLDKLRPNRLLACRCATLYLLLLLPRLPLHLLPHLLLRLLPLLPLLHRLPHQPRPQAWPEPCLQPSWHHFGAFSVSELSLLQMAALCRSSLR